MGILLLSLEAMRMVAARTFWAGAKEAPPTKEERSARTGLVRFAESRGAAETKPYMVVGFGATATGNGHKSWAGSERDVQRGRWG